MYNRPGWRWASMGIASVHARQMPAGRHEGAAGEFLRRHECEAKQAARSSRRELQEFANQLLTRAGDTRNVKTAIEHCASRGQAAGPNGLKPSDLDNRSQWALARVLGELIREGQYRPSEPRTDWIDKGRGRGQRPIRIQNFEDRCVERAVLQVINPILDTQFVDHSMGFRSPGYPREFALATAEHWALTHNQWSWISGVGDRILVASYGSGAGADCFAVEVRSAFSARAGTFDDPTCGGIEITDYAEYLTMTGQLLRGSP